MLDKELPKELLLVPLARGCDRLASRAVGRWQGAPTKTAVDFDAVQRIFEEVQHRRRPSEPAGIQHNPWQAVLVLLPAALSFAGCGGSEAGDAVCGDPVFTPEEITAYSRLSPLPAVPVDPSNKHADAAAAARLGQRFFFEKSWAGPIKVASSLGAEGEEGKIACRSCHDGPAFDDQRSLPNNVSLGTGYHRRNSPPVVNSAFYKWTNWAGRFDAQWSLPRAVFEAGVIFNSTRLRVAHVVFDKYRDDYNSVFTGTPLDPALGSGSTRFPAMGKPKKVATDPDGPWERMSAADQAHVNRVVANVGKALSAYMRLLVARDAPFDRFVAGNDAAISSAAKRGLKLFVGKANCNRCHDNAHFSDDTFHNLGIAQSGMNVPAEDLGRFGDLKGLLGDIFNTRGDFSDDATFGDTKLAGLAADPLAVERGRFRTKGLRQIALTAPYMHAGQLATLEDVIDFYDRGGDDTGFAGVKDAVIVPLNLESGEKADLKAFLETLTGADLPAELTADTSAP